MRDTHAPRAVAFAGGVLDRADPVRADPAALAALAAHGRLLLLDGLEPLLGEGGALCSAPVGPDAGELIFLGRDEAGIGWFIAAPDAASASTAPPNPALWEAIASMAPADLALYGTARSLAGWHARHRFCARCGAPTRLAKGGWQRSCASEACAADHFPRTDPVVIMSVAHEGRLLLGRQPRFPPHRYSALAGFIEPGEAVEEAVAREIWEEAGLRVADVRYVASQPWPFPSSLMLACHAEALDDAITIDTTELEDARWFTRAEV
ncbi:MAG TPA: NAD(+) diphosphatase, partial [Novosphingobium sp.]|nr:NAD(+) diphosphatase [Novosphingobium sp.]